MTHLGLVPAEDVSFAAGTATTRVGDVSTMPGGLPQGRLLTCQERGHCHRALSVEDRDAKGRFPRSGCSARSKP